MKQDILKGMKLGIKPFFVLNTVLVIFPLYYLGQVNIFVAMHVFFVYVNFCLMGLLIIKYFKAKGVL